MEIKTTEETMKDIKDFARNLQRLQLQKKVIDDEIKDMKQTWKENGVAVGKVTKVLNRIKALQKQTEADKFEEALLEEQLSQDVDIQDQIAQLNAT